ncbi:MAG: ThiF family adenylyltransferase [Candidatus Nanopelagicales bacterium]
MLNPGLRRVWRDPATVQFGVDVPDPVLLTGVDDDTADLLRRLDGSREWPDVVATTATADHPADATEELLQRLSASNLLIDAAGWPGGKPLTAQGRARLAPDLAAAATHSGAAAPAKRCERLAQAAVTIVGVGRLGAVLASLLTASGVGRLDLRDKATVDASDMCVGGFTPADAGTVRQDLGRTLEQWQCVARTNAPSALTIVTDVSDTRALSGQLFATATPHLMVSCSEAIGRIGPFVLPGQSACMRCIDLARGDNDAGWPKVAVQVQNRAGDRACDSNLAISTAALAAVHVTSWLAGGKPSSVNGIVELHLPDGEATCRTARFHPACGCQWPNPIPRETMAP